MERVELLATSLDELPQIAAKVVAMTAKPCVIAFYGEMGAGKTTFIKALCKTLGVVDTVTSPTFSLVNEYVDQSGNSIYHFDFYRIKNEAEAYDMGYEDYFYSGNYCFVEWPEKIPNLLPPHYVSIEITERAPDDSKESGSGNTSSRTFTIGKL